MNRQKMELESQLDIANKNLESLERDYETLQNELTKNTQIYETKIMEQTKKIQNIESVGGSLQTEFDLEVQRIS